MSGPAGANTLQARTRSIAKPVITRLWRIEREGYDRLPAEGRYTYQFDSESGALDHAFASPSLRAQVSGAGVWHTNADEPPFLAYDGDLKHYAPTPYRASDHDPVLIDLE